MIPIAQIAPILRLGSPLKFVKSVKIALEFCHRYGMPSISLEVTNYPLGVRGQGDVADFLLLKPLKRESLSNLRINFSKRPDRQIKTDRVEY